MRLLASDSVAGVFKAHRIFDDPRKNAKTTTIGENFRKCYSATMATCIVSFVDLDGVRHSVEVEAEGLYEASVLGLCAFRKHELEPAGLTQLEIEVLSSVKHTLTVSKVREWLQRGVRTPKEAILKEKLRELLSS